MKKFLSVFFALALVFTLALPAFALDPLPYLTDQDDLLIPPDEETVQKKLEEESKKANGLIAVYTAPDYDEAKEEINSWAVSRDSDSPAVFLLISSTDLSYGVLQYGDMPYEFDDSFSDVFYPSLTRGDYYNAFQEYAEGARRVMTGEKAVPDTPEHGSLLWDDAGLLTASEARELLETLRSRSESADCDIAVLTRDYISEDEINSYAAEWYQEQGYSDDAVLLVISAEDRGWCVYVHGACDKAIEDIDGFFDLFRPYLADTEWKDAFDSYAQNADRIVKAYRATGERLRKPYKKTWILIGVGGGLLVAYLVTNSMKQKLHSVAFQRAAANYVVPGSMNLTNSSDLYLYSTVTRTAKPKDTSSSRSGGGGGGRSSSGHF